MANTIQFKRGALSGLPSLAAGEPGFTTDQFRLYVGSAGGNRLVALLHNNAATSAPTVNDDSGDGYSVGSRWIDTTADKAYECVDSSVGSAVWQQQSGTGTVGTVAVADGGTGRTSHTAYAVLCGGTTSTGAQQSIASVGTSGQVLTSNGAGALPTFQTLATGTVPRGHIDGLTLSYNSTTLLSIAAGQCADSTGAKLLELSAFTKTLQSSGSWTAGTGNNGLDTGARAANTWYHVFVIADSTGATVDVLFSTSATSPTMPSGYALFRRVGSVYTTASALFSDWWRQCGDTFLWTSPKDDVSALNPGTSAVTRTLSTPLGVRTRALLSAGFDANATGDNPAAVYLSDLSQTDAAAGLTTTTCINYSPSAYIANMSVPAEIWTNTSSQIRSRIQASATNTRLRIQTHGWIDARGKDGL